LPKSRSIEIANGKNGLPLITDALAMAKPKFRYWDHDRPYWPNVAASFFFKTN